MRRRQTDGMSSASENPTPHAPRSVSIRLVRPVCVLLAMQMSLFWNDPCSAKPTREQIVALGERCKQQKTRMDLVKELGTDFSGLDLSGVDFRGYHYVNNETILRNADFRGCNLTGAEFGSAILDGSDFTGARLQRVSFVTASVRQAILVDADLDGTRFYQSDLSGAKLSHADLSRADITGSTFAGADLAHATLSGAKSEYWWTDFSSADLSGANLAGMNLAGARFTNVVLRLANLSGANLHQADFAGADLTGAILDSANVDAADFRSARGLSEVERKRLQKSARRWLFDLKTGISGFLGAMRFPAYLGTVVTLVGMSFRAFQPPPLPKVVRVAACINVFAVLPACAMILLFAAGAHPIAQFDAGSATAMQGWSIWFHIWPLLMFDLLVCFCAAVVTVLTFLATHLRWSKFKNAQLAFLYTVLTVVHCLFALHWIGSNFPDA
jgi:uncharacterized protein YjbI with pentapeptide repeats